MPGIYVERRIQGSLDAVWRLTQTPEVHQRWDLRFTSIRYLPHTPGTPQQFLYVTRILPGLAVRGTGETLGERTSRDGSATSALRFAADTSWSLIDEGSGYWKYIPAANTVRFLTWYDYRTRFGLLGRLADRLGFRPMLGWATAWSFDRLALWIEREQTPELSLQFAGIHAIARVSVAAVWLWHGLVPKLLFHHADELAMLAQAGVSARVLAPFGVMEVVFSVAMLLTWEYRIVLLLNVAAMICALVGVVLRSPQYVVAAFNPVTLNGLMIAVSLMGWLAAGAMPLARRCRRTPKEAA